tara:strand:+ start:5660 stop:6067 length:408 start_codon:yes stop_codon:yes gene_type:complete
MHFPSDIEAQIKQFAQPCAATTRPDWREGSSIFELLEQDPWWSDYNCQCLYQGDEDTTWVEWCTDKMIIGPPRYRSGRELAELDQGYLTGEEFLTHCLPWIKTWAETHWEDMSWCTGPHHTTLPDWVIREYGAEN